MTTRQHPFLVVRGPGFCRLPAQGALDTEHHIRSYPTARQVAIAYWGADVTAHTVYHGECPYRFYASCTDIDLIADILEECPPQALKAAQIPLPCELMAGSTPLCYIGDPQRAQPPSQLSYMGWLSKKTQNASG